VTTRPLRVWPVAMLALPAAVSIWSGWVGLGQMTGFGKIQPLPGTPLAGWTLDTAITLPIGMEAYAAFALHVWLSGRAPQRAAVFAQWSAVGALVLGAAGQVAYHLMAAAGMQSAPWLITTAVACLPVAVLGMGAALAHLIRADALAPQEVHPEPRLEAGPESRREDQDSEPEGQPGIGAESHIEIRLEDHAEDQPEGQQGHPEDRPEVQLGDHAEDQPDQPEKTKARPAHGPRRYKTKVSNEVLRDLADTYVATCRAEDRSATDRGLVDFANARDMALGRARARDLLAAVSTPHPVRDAGVARPVVLLAVVVSAGFMLGAAPSWTVSALVALGALAVPVAAAVVVAVLRIQGRKNAEREARLHWVDVPISESAKGQP
jgi:hypothetical protein